jgi:hypothetical protein
MNRRSLFAALTAALVAPFAAKAAVIAHMRSTARQIAIPQEVIEVDFDPAEWITEPVSAWQARKDAQYDELAAMILARQEFIDEWGDRDGTRHVAALYRFEINGYCCAMRRAYPEDRLVNFSLDWARERASGRVPLAPDTTEEMFAPQYILVTHEHRVAEVERRRVRDQEALTNGRVIRFSSRAETADGRGPSGVSANHGDDDRSFTLAPASF